MEGKRTDLRVVKTRKALVDALMELLREKSLEDIRVSELCERAMVRKATFYNHFHDKQDLFAYMVRDIQQSYKNRPELEATRGDIAAYCVAVFGFQLDFFEQNEDMITTILRSSGYSSALVLLFEKIEQEHYLRFCEERDRGVELPCDPHIFAAGMTGASIQVSHWWFTSNPRMKREEVVRQFEAMIAFDPKTPHEA